MKQHYDIIIVGGGMVGSTLALALGQTNPALSIALIENDIPEPVAVDSAYDLRVSALTKSSVNLLKNLGVWSALHHGRISPFTDMVVWENTDSELHFDSADMGETALGVMIENRHLQTTTLNLCQNLNNIDIIAPARPSAYQQKHITLDDGKIISARLIVAADGGNSPIRQWAGIQHRGWSYQQKGLVCTVSTEHSHQFTAWQRFLPEGPLALLPQPNEQQCSIVWSLNNDSAERLLLAPESDFIAELEQAYQQRLGHITAVSARAAFPLKLQYASHYVQPGLALIGDAAHTIHPLAGQGVNIGLLDAACLTEVVSLAHQQGRDIGNLHTLQKYQRQRRADNLLIQLSMDMFKRTFSSQLAPVKWLRQFGLQSVNKQVWLKNLFMHQASSRPFAQPVLNKPKS